MTSSVRFRIVLAFLVVVTTLLSAVVFLMVQYQGVARAQALVTEGYLPLALQVDQIEGDQQRVEKDIQRLLDAGRRPLTGGQSMAAIYSEGLRDTILEARAHATQAVFLAEEPEERAALNKTQLHLARIEELVKSYQAEAQRSVQLSDQGDKDGAAAAAEALRKNGRSLAEEVEKLSTLLDGRIRMLTAQVDARRKRASTVAVALTALALVFSAVALMAVLAALHPIGQLTDHVQRLARGERPAKLDVRGRDEIALLASEFDRLVEALEARDRTLIERAEQQRRATENLARSERLALIGQMLAQITHEVRNPLNAISLNAEMLGDELERLDGEHKTEAWALLATVSGEIERLTEVTAHYLQLARRPKATLQAEDLAELLADVLRLLRGELEQQGVTLEVAYAPMPPQRVDGNQLRQALLNIVRNAVEAGARRIRVALEADAEVRIVLEDDGPGMTSEQVERAFDPFYSTKATGTGLGLAITRQILEDHDGTVRVASSPGSGARVTLVLPPRPEEPEAVSH